MKEIILKDEHATRDFAKKIAVDVLNKPRGGKAMILALVGDLGAGKTTFAQAFAKALGVNDRILSPTFLIFKRYAIACGGFSNFYHTDAYRIKNAAELDVLGFAQILKDQRNIVLIEWADKIKEIIPRNALWLEFKHGNTLNERVVALQD